MTDTIDAPMAKRMSTWRSRVSAGTTMIPPPRPSSEPSMPAATDRENTATVKRKGVMNSLPIPLE
jgi:hypothetical protein